MKQYQIYKPNGEKVSINHPSQFYELRGEFARFVSHYGAEASKSSSLSDNAFANLENITRYWNHNVSVVEALVQDEDFLLSEKKAQTALNTAEFLKIINTDQAGQ